MKRVYFLVQIRSKFGNKNDLECSLKSMNWRTPKSSNSIHWKVWSGRAESGGQAQDFSVRQLMDF